MFNFIYKNVDYAHKIDKPSSPTENYEKHLHPYHEILYLVKGEVDYTVESETYKMREGSLIFIQSGKYHFASVNEKYAYERFVIKFPDSVIPQFVKNRLISNGVFFPGGKRYAVFFNQFESYFKHYTDEEIHVMLLADTVKLLIMLSRESDPMKNAPNGFISEIVNYIEDNIHSQITLESLKQTFNFSKSYISNEFHKYMKIPIMQYIKTKKIILAHQMILNGEKKSAVCEKLGFEDYSTFYRSYVKVMGFAPSGSAAKAEKKEKRGNE